MRRRAISGTSSAGSGGFDSGLTWVQASDEMVGSLEMALAGRERTSEFFAAATSLGGANRSRPKRGPSGAPALAFYAYFMRSARLVSKNVSSTYAKLEKLTMLAANKSLFDDRFAEIQELTYIIKNDLGSLNKEIAKLSEMPSGQRHVHSHSSNVVLHLQSRLASMSNHFKQVLEVRSENLKVQNTRRERFTKGLPPPRGSALAVEDDLISSELSNGAPSGRLYDSQKMLMKDQTDDYVAQRAETMHNIESTIVELGGIFQQLAHMVKEQDEMVTRIDTNIEDAELNVEAAHSQILKYFQSVSGNRMLMIKIFGVLMLFSVFFLVFLT